VKRLAYLFAMPALLSADWKIVTRTGDRTLTEYFKGSLSRTDSSPAYTTVMDSEHRRQVNWTAVVGRGAGVTDCGRGPNVIGCNVPICGDFMP
jgi:hypothetical protein